MITVIISMSVNPRREFAHLLGEGLLRHFWIDTIPPVFCSQQSYLFNQSIHSFAAERLNQHAKRSNRIVKLVLK
ncbi:MAG: hypothetical protein WA159_23360 [Variovorax sp.]